MQAPQQKLGAGFGLFGLGFWFWNKLNEQIQNFKKDTVGPLNRSGS